jgi:16S rRNA (guanine527-N7)-methyltransferase
MPLGKEDRELLLEGLSALLSCERSQGQNASLAGGAAPPVQADRTFISEKADLLSRFIDELLLWNAKTNLTGTAAARDIIIRHIFDSLSVYHLLKGSNASILDIGAGAGFPSVPIALVDDALRITAVERRRKRADFLRNAALLLRLDNLTVIQMDVRDIRGVYDVVLARGVGELSTVYGLARKKLKEQAMIIAFKGKITEIEKEISRLRQKTADARGMGLSIQKVKVPFLDEEERNIVIIEMK